MRIYCKDSNVHPGRLSVFSTSHPIGMDMVRSRKMNQIDFIILSFWRSLSILKKKKNCYLIYFGNFAIPLYNCVNI